MSLALTIGDALRLTKGSIFYSTCSASHLEEKDFNGKIILRVYSVAG